MGPAVCALTVHTPRARTAAHDDAIDRAYQRIWTTSRATFTTARSRTDLIDPEHAEDAVRMVHDGIVASIPNDAGAAREAMATAPARHQA